MFFNRVSCGIKWTLWHTSIAGSHEVDWLWQTKCGGLTQRLGPMKWRRSFFWRWQSWRRCCQLLFNSLIRLVEGSSKRCISALSPAWLAPSLRCNIGHHWDDRSILDARICAWEEDGCAAVSVAVGDSKRIEMITFTKSQIRHYTH